MDMKNESTDIKRRNRRRKGKAGRKRILIPGIIAGILAAIGFGLFVYYEEKTDLVYKEVWLEAGSEAPDITEFLSARKKR